MHIKKLTRSKFLELFNQAFERIFGKPSSRLNEARWLIAFAQANTNDFSEKEWQMLQFEVLLFAYRQVSPMTQMPSKSDLRHTQKWLNQFLTKLENNSVHIEIKSWSASLAYFEPVATGLEPGDTIKPEGIKRNRCIRGVINQTGMTWSDAFKFQVYDSLTSSDVKGRFRFCLNKKCRRAFIPNKRQAYCSTACSQSHRTRIWRAKNRNKLRAKRREYYARKQRENVGLNVRIQTRKGASR